MSWAFIIHADRGGGKTRTAEAIAEKAKAHGFKVKGIISRRVRVNCELVGYNALDLDSGEIFPLARNIDICADDKWFYHDRLIYGFSKNGFTKANNILKQAAEDLSECNMIFLDEYGHLELSGNGLYSGFITVINHMKNLFKKSVIVIMCRNNKLKPLKKILEESEMKTKSFKAVDPESIWKKMLSVLM